MNIRVIVSALVRNNDSFLFIKQNKTGGAYPNALHIPGGGLEPGEHPDDGVRREIREETGIEVTNLQQFDFDSDVTDYKDGKIHFIFLRYICDYASGMAKPSSDAAEIIWVSETDIKVQKHNPPSLRLLEKLHMI